MDPAIDALLGAFGGGALRIAPELIDAWKHRKAPANPAATLAKPATIIEPPGVASADATGLMVSIVTLWLLVLYTVDKALALYVAITQQASLADVTNLIWTSSDMEIFGGAVAFWFIDRALAMRRTS